MNTDKPPLQEVNDEIEWDIEDIKQAYVDAAEKGYDSLMDQDNAHSSRSG